jgi:hypothetical protein
LTGDGKVIGAAGRQVIETYVLPAMLSKRLSLNLPALGALAEGIESTGR